VSWKVHLNHGRGGDGGEKAKGEEKKTIPPGTLPEGGTVRVIIKGWPVRYSVGEGLKMCRKRFF